MSRDGYIDKRGNARDRAARRAWMIATFDTDLPGQARCRLRLAPECLSIVDVDTLSVDRIVFGGSYARSNIQPACLPCQSLQGGIEAVRVNSLLDEYRAARDSVLARRESSELAPTSVAGAANSGAAMHQLEGADMLPLPCWKDWLIEQRAAREHTESALCDDQRTG